MDAKQDVKSVRLTLQLQDHLGGFSVVIKEDNVYWIDEILTTKSHKEAVDKFYDVTRKINPALFKQLFHKESGYMLTSIYEAVPETFKPLLSNKG